MLSIRPRRARRLRRRAMPALLALVALAATTLLAGATPAGASEETALRAAAIDELLVKQLAANPTGGVPAVVTTWGRDGLDDVLEVGVKGTQLRVLPMILTPSLTQAQLDALRQSPAVRSVWANREYELAMEDTTWITRARYVWSQSTPEGGPEGLGVTGRGVELAMIDTGFDGMHEDGDNLIEFCETLQAVTSTRQSVACTPWDTDFNTAPAGPCGALGAGLPAPFPDLTGPDECVPGVHPARGDSHDPDVSHGTHVGGTILGTGHASGGTQYAHSTIGLAPHAKFRVYSANVASSLTGHQILSSYDDMTYKKERGYSKVVAVNNSWGGGGGSNYNPSDPQHVAFKRAWQAGILSVFAAGNSGPEHNTLGAQCVSPFVACVAATTKADQVVAFSSRGRPSQVADTDRDGTAGDPGDVKPDNHDWRLGQALEVGRYRPTLAAPGVAINSMKAIGLNIGDPTSAACREDPLIEIDDKAGCYVQAQGTSMAAPHVTGAVGLIVQAFRQGHSGRTPSPNEIIDILERSANKTKLPAWEAEEQGAGRLDAYEAVRLASSYERNGPRPNIGYATPPYADGAYPGGPLSVLANEDKKGCTGPGSWSSRTADFSFTEPPADAPPLPSGTYAQHFIDVPEKVDRLRITITWPKHATANLYARLWRPGVMPDSDTQTPDYSARTSAYFQTRAWPDQEATGLPVGLPPTMRLVDVRSPEESNVGVRGTAPIGRTTPAEGGAPPALPSVVWVLRVYHRAGGAPTVCETPSDEQPPQLVRTGYEYDLKVEVGRVTHRPSVRIDSIGDRNERFVEIRGRAGYPPPDNPPLGNRGHSWEGVTNWEVPGSAGPAEGGNEELPDGGQHVRLYFHGNNHTTSEPGEGELGCTSQGNVDVAIVGCGPFLLPDPLSTMPLGARFGPVSPVIDGVADRNLYDPNWTWCLATGPGCPPPPLGGSARPGPRTVQGPMTVEWWASTIPACETPGAFTMGWVIRLWADGRLAFESSRVEATPEICGAPSRLETTVFLPRIRAEQRFVLQIDTHDLDVDQEATFVYYDSENPCLGAPPGPACDSLVQMPVVPNEGGGGGGATGVPQNVRVTDLPVTDPGEYPAPSLTPALRVAWDSVGAGASYRVHRSTNPAFIPSSSNRVYSGPGQACPQGESPNTPNDDNPPGEERDGVCFTDTSVSLLVTYYYRVVAVQNTTPGASSGVAYGTPTRYDRQVKLKVDRLYGPQVWEYALLSPSPTPLDTTNQGTQWRFLWDTLELLATEYTTTEAEFGFDNSVPPRPTVRLPETELSTIPHLIFARSFTQGIGSTKDGRLAELDDDPGPDPDPGPGCPDDDDGDGDDDDDDGDSDDDGDDGDDDCEDDDDDEEDDDD